VHQERLNGFEQSNESKFARWLGLKCEVCGRYEVPEYVFRVEMMIYGALDVIFCAGQFAQRIAFNQIYSFEIKF